MWSVNSVEIESTGMRGSNSNLSAQIKNAVTYRYFISGLTIEQAVVGLSVVKFAQ